MNFFEDYFDEISNKMGKMDKANLESAVRLIIDTGDAGGKIIIAGNGASAAIASHIAVDLTKNSGVRAVTFNEADLITCFANDYGYERWIEKAIEFYADKKDIIVLISSSGKSKNIVNAALKAKKLGLKIITFSGFSSSNPLKQTGDLNFYIDSSKYNIVETVHQAWLLAIVDKITKDRKN